MGINKSVVFCEITLFYYTPKVYNSEKIAYILNYHYICITIEGETRVS